MSNEEMSNEFDVLYNNIMGGDNVAPGLDEYEKSVFLTKAQDEIVKDYFNPRLNKSMEGYDGNQKRQIDFSMIMRTVSYPAAEAENAELDNRDNSKRFNIADDVMMFINEFVDVTRNTKNVRLTVIAIGYDEYARVMQKPYKRPQHYQAWRILDNADSKNKAEIVVGTKDVITKYTIRYVKRPRAIILQDLDGDVTLDGVQEKQTCELDPILHPEILQRAVELAKAAYVGDINTQLALGQASQTNIGAVQQAR